ncbi:hypothetical protein [Salinigranum rubrum]|uniref:hypothetical protein n=1 Tax=Salinigranum rubrum TaxID=755307 RepID=UPI001C1F750E|nr:hypothetical protein [Salinigranum rubrum]
MEVRDAVEADAEALAAIVDAPADVMRNVVHDRTVRVAVRQNDPGPNADVEMDTGVDVENGSDAERGTEQERKTGRPRASSGSSVSTRARTRCT